MLDCLPLAWWPLFTPDDMVTAVGSASVMSEKSTHAAHAAFWSWEFCKPILPPNNFVMHELIALEFKIDDWEHQKD